MANYERRVYEPSDEVRVFDGSEEDDDVEGSRLPLLIVLALLVLAMFAGVVWLAYTQGVARGRGETPILTAANGPEKVAPQQAGGTNVPYQGFKIYEQPAPPDDAAEAAPVDAAKPAAPPPVAQAPKPAPVAAAPAPAPAPVATTPAPAPVAAKPAAAGGAYVLQIGAFKSQAEADTAWRAYKGKHAALLTGYNSDIQQADLGEKGTWYRLRIAGFGDREVASALCDRLKADGGGCFLGR